LDDALRLCLADAPLLLTTSLLVLTPAAMGLLWLVAEPRPASWWLRPILPAVVAALFAVTGLATALCQELCARRLQAEPMTLAGWLRGVAASGLGHVCLRTIALVPYGIAAAIAVSLARVARTGTGSAWPIIAGAIALAVVRLVLGPPLFSLHPAWT